MFSRILVTLSLAQTAINAQHCHMQGNAQTTSAALLQYCSKLYHSETTLQPKRHKLTEDQIAHLSRHCHAFVAESHAVNNIDDYEKTLLIYCAEFGITELAELFLRHNADVTAQDFTGQTALMKAAYRGNDEIVKLLLQQDDTLAPRLIAQVDKDGWNALTYAIANNQKNSIQLLIQHDASLEVKDRLGRTYEHIAQERGHAHITREFLQNLKNQNDTRDDELKINCQPIITSPTATYYIADGETPHLTPLHSSSSSEDFFDFVTEIYPSNDQATQTYLHDEIDHTEKDQI